jgi:hypothetical protein
MMTPTTVRASIALSVLFAAAPAVAFDSSKLEFERTVENVSAPGLYHVEVDPELYRHARAADLADLRIVDHDNAEVPWLVRRVPPAQRPEPRAVTVADTRELADGSARAILDFGASGGKHSQVTLAVDAAGDWARKALVDASNDERAWTPLADGAYLFRIGAGAGATGAEKTTLAYPTSSARYVRVTLLPSRNAAPLHIRGATAAFVPPEAHVPLRLLPSVKPQPVPQPGEPKTSEWTIDLGAPGVPLAELALDLTDPSFERRALLSAAPYGAAAAAQPPAFTPVAATLLFRAPAAVAGKLAEENVRVPAARTRTRYLRLTVYNGDDAPLALRSVSPAYDAEELIFRAPAGGAYTLYVGGDVPAPRYALAAELARSGEQPALAASLGTVTPNPTYGHLAKAPSPPPAGHHDTLPIIVGLALFAALGALWAMRVVRRARA